MIWTYSPAAGNPLSSAQTVPDASLAPYSGPNNHANVNGFTTDGANAWLAVGAGQEATLPQPLQFTGGPAVAGTEAFTATGTLTAAAYSNIQNSGFTANWISGWPNGTTYTVTVSSDPLPNSDSGNATNTANQTSFQTFNYSLSLSPDTVKGYVSYLEETFLVHIIPKCSPSLNERTYSPKKIYFADVGIRNALTGFKDMGALAENLVFLKIKGRGNVCYRHEHGKEVDFIVGKTAIEVKFKDLVEPGDVAGLSAMPNGDKLLVARKAGRTSGIPAVSLCDFLMSAHG